MIRKYNASIQLFLAVAFILTLVSCDPAKKYEKAERETIDFYLSANSSLNFVLKPSGLYYLDVVVGTGRTPVLHDTAYITYSAYLLNGYEIGSNVGDSSLKVRGVGEGILLPGLDEGVQYMKVGGESKMLLPSSLAYGTQGSGVVSAYTPLVYDIILDSVSPGPGKK